ncbi:hypothetical protein EBQ81_00660, partial [bacterium]|nr:hypothetical protein [bacterium]
MSKLNKEDAKKELWRRGVLSWKLDATQKELYSLFYNSSHRVQTWLLARRSGKTYTLCVLALEQCVRHPNSIVKFISPTKLQISTIIRPLLKKLLEDCPEELKPEFRGKEYIYYFPNGSEIQLAGTDSGHAEKLRGGDSHICIVDEAGSCGDLENVVKSVLLPTTLITKGRVLLAGTPPSEPDHDFIKFIEEAEMRGSLIRKTVYDNPRISPEQLNELIVELGGLNTDAAKRELLCMIIKDSNTAVIPEMTDELAEKIVKEWPKPPFFDAYVGMDLGIVDLTVVIFGYYDFRAAKLIIEDELVVKGTDFHLPKFVENIQKIEDNLWTNALTGEKRKARRVSDINYIVTKEIARISNGDLIFDVAKKDDNEAALNKLRVMLANEQIIIHPKCTTLVRHLKNVKWKSTSNRVLFGRSPDDGHYDAVDALKYLIRNINFNKNPYPAHLNMNYATTNYIEATSGYYDSGKNDIYH